MRIDTNTRTLILERTDCRTCKYSPGTTSSTIKCPKCSGTGNGPKGGKRSCRDCYGTGTRYDNVNRITCPDCNGHHHEHTTEGICDRMPTDQWKDLIRWEVVRSNNESTAVERAIGAHGAIVSVSTYREHKTQDADVIAEAVEYVGSSTQAIHFTRKADLRIADRVMVVLRPNFLCVIPAWDEEVQQ